MKNLFNRLNDRQKKLAKIIAAMLIVAVLLFAVLQVLTRLGNSNNDMAKHETSTETSSSKESSKKNDDKKNQTSKKDDKKKDDKKKDDKKEDTSTTSETPVTNTTVVEQQNQTNGVVTNTPTTNTTPSTPAPQPIYQTIHHDEVGHWETQVIAEAWDEPVYERKIIGNNTGTVYSSTLEFAGNTNGDEGYHVGNVQVGTTHHDAVTQQVWVVDQAAWDETVIVGYR